MFLIPFGIFILAAIIFTLSVWIGTKIIYQDDRLTLKNAVIPYKEIKDVYTHYDTLLPYKVTFIQTSEYTYRNIKNKTLMQGDTLLWKYLEKEITEAKREIDFEDHIAHIDHIYVIFRNKWDNSVSKFTSSQFSVTEKIGFLGVERILTISDPNSSISLSGFSLQKKHMSSLNKKVFMTVLLRMGNLN